jgi:hypothetical protein
MSETTSASPDIVSSSDLLKLGYQEDELLLEDVSLCGQCTFTCTSTGFHD